MRSFFKGRPSKFFKDCLVTDVSERPIVKGQDSPSSLRTACSITDVMGQHIGPVELYCLIFEDRTETLF
jgi:hypothetical protein